MVELKWLSPVLCSLEEKVRVERGPQYVELDCTDENLDDSKTHPHYRIGGRDAHGNFIRPDEITDPSYRAQVKAEIINPHNPFKGIAKGEKMTVVDYRQKIVPHLWKIYVWEATTELNKKGEPIWRWIQKHEVLGKDDALALAESVYNSLVNDGGS